MLALLRPALVFLVLLTLATGVAYPLAITAFARLVAPGAAEGSLVRQGGKVVGSVLIGQAFTSDRYARGRPSATTAVDPNDASKTIDSPYNAASSIGSNLGPVSKKLLAQVEDRVAALRTSGAEAVPSDAVTASASGLDPHISPAFAELQVARVAASRGVTEARIREIVGQVREVPRLGVIGEPRVNVLRLNLALDAALGAGVR